MTRTPEQVATALLAHFAGCPACVAEAEAVPVIAEAIRTERERAVAIVEKAFHDAAFSAFQVSRSLLIARIRGTSE